MADPRAYARALARESIERGDVTGWFERLYAESQREDFPISWVDLAPNPYLVDWIDAEGGSGLAGRAAVVGCGYGDDAEYLSARGLDVVAFDIAPSAIERCHARFPATRVRYDVADVFDLPPAWQRAFDFVFEAYTVQVLPGRARAAAAASIGRLVADRGRLLVVARSRNPSEPEGLMPWPLTRDELDAFTADGLLLASARDVVEPGDPPVPRFVAEFVRP